MLCQAGELCIFCGTNSFYLSPAKQLLVIMLATLKFVCREKGGKTQADVKT